MVMYKETDSNLKGGFLSIIVFGVVLVAVYEIFSVVNIFPIIKDLIFMGVAVCFVIWFMKYRLSSYDYELKDEEIIITENLGNRVRGQAIISYASIKLFTDINHSEKINCETKIMCTSKKNRHIILFDIDSKDKKIIFAPSEKFVELLNEKIILHQGGIKN